VWFDEHGNPITQEQFNELRVPRNNTDDTPEEVTIENADDNPLDCTACWMRSNLPADTD